MPIFHLELQRTYWSQGFFNITVDYDRFVRSSEGEVELILGKNGSRIKGTINRSANPNGTARILGRAPLKKWFQANFKQGGIVNVDLTDENKIILF